MVSKGSCVVLMQCELKPLDSYHSIILLYTTLLICKPSENKKIILLENLWKFYWESSRGCKIVKHGEYSHVTQHAGAISLMLISRVNL